jgi:lysophospholipase L1-like esterase
LKEAFSKIPGIHDEYSITGNPTSGLRFNTLNIDLLEVAKLGSSDVLIVQTLGNDLLHKRVKRVDGLIHLTEFIPRSNSSLEEKYILLEKICILARPANIFIIDNPFRHLLGPLGTFTHKGLHHYWETRNVKLRDRFPSYAVDHLMLLNIRKKKLKNKTFYSSLQVDGVHFRKQIYCQMVNRLKEKISAVKHQFDTYPKLI